MKGKWIAVIGSGALAIGFAVAGASFADTDGTEVKNGTIRIEKQTEAEFPSMAKISMDQAVERALASVQGQILKAELDDENGFLVYDVEVVSAAKAIKADRFLTAMGISAHLLVGCYRESANTSLCRLG